MSDPQTEFADQRVVDPKNLRPKLSSFVIPEDLGITRDLPAHDHAKTERFRGKYDYRTVIYDCVYDAEAGELRLICPKLFNFRRLIEEGLRVNGAPVARMKVKEYQRWDLIRIALPKAPKSVEIQIADRIFDVGYSQPEFDAFRDLNCVIMVSRNNRLTWLRDFARYYVDAHGLSAIILFDNGSTDYDLDELRATLADVEGIERIAVIDAPFPFGSPGAPKKWQTTARYFQCGMINVARYRMLRDAGAVIHVDVDEMIFSPEGKSIFEEARKSRFGYLKAPGTWVYSAYGAEVSRHVDHIARSDGSVPESAPAKWCIRPNCLAARGEWRVHSVGGKLTRRTARADMFRFWHCRQISQSWFYDRSRAEDKLPPDTELQAFWQSTCLADAQD